MNVIILLDEQKFLVSKYLDMTQGEVITNLIDKEMVSAIYIHD